MKINAKIFFYVDLNDYTYIITNKQKEKMKKFIENAANYAEKFNQGFDAQGFVNNYASYYIKDQLDSVVENLVGASCVSDINDEDKEELQEIFMETYMDAVNELITKSFDEFKAGNFENFDEDDLEWMNDCEDDSELLEGLQDGYFDGVVDMNYIADLLNEYVDTKTWNVILKEIVEVDFDDFVFETKVELEYSVEGYDGFSFKGNFESFISANKIDTDKLIGYILDEGEYEIDEYLIRNAIESESDVYITFD